MSYVPTAYVMSILGVITLTLIALWFTDRAKLYLLWWALAHLTLSLLIVIFIPVTDVSFVHVLVFNLCHSFTTSAFIGAAFLYRKLPVTRKYFVFGALLLTFFSFAVELLMSRSASALIAAGGIFICLLYTSPSPRD